jgi:hypothetical protein
VRLVNELIKKSETQGGSLTYGPAIDPWVLIKVSIPDGANSEVRNTSP